MDLSNKESIFIEVSLRPQIEVQVILHQDYYLQVCKIVCETFYQCKNYIIIILYEYTFLDNNLFDKICIVFMIAYLLINIKRLATYKILTFLPTYALILEYQLGKNQSFNIKLWCLPNLKSDLKWKENYIAL